jgi:hypothetical protein
MCRRVLHTGRNLPVTVTLASILSQCFPQDTESRRRESGSGTSGVAASGQSDVCDLPVFVMSCMLPGESIALNIFEPRYRLMFRRCMEGNSKLAMTCALRVRLSS